MNLFKTLTLRWWQISLFRLGLLALGIAIGAYWHDFFGGYILILIIVAAVSLAYVIYVWWKTGGNVIARCELASRLSMCVVRLI
jgi:hypothetical protein